jgi:(p)ppGpp synthase/HD superfamily hydrolase
VSAAPGAGWDVEAVAGPEVVRLARDRHRGQVDRQDRDYYEAHLLPIARLLLPFGSAAVTAGLLHDVVEDTGTTLGELRALGLPESVISAVDAVSRRDGERYEDLIGRACADPLGRLVKLADNWHNLSGLDDLAAIDAEAADRLRARYLAARARLSAAVEEAV